MQMPERLGGGRSVFGFNKDMVLEEEGFDPEGGTMVCGTGC